MCRRAAAAAVVVATAAVIAVAAVARAVAVVVVVVVDFEGWCSGPVEDALFWCRAVGQWLQWLLGWRGGLGRWRQLRISSGN